MQSHVRFNKVPEKVPDKYPDKVPGDFGAEPVHVQQGSGEGFGEGLGGFGAKETLRKPRRGVSSAWLRSTLQKDL